MITDSVKALITIALGRDWHRTAELPSEEVETLFRIVRAGGFEPKKLVPGKLLIPCRELGPGSTGKTVAVNDTCPYKVIGQDDTDDRRATGWLNSILRLAGNYGSWVPGKVMCPEGLVTEVMREIDRSVPLKPIQLTLDDDSLKECPPPITDSYFVDHTRDHFQLGSCVGIHNKCGGWVYRKLATEANDTLDCKGCIFRTTFTNDIGTYGGLRQFFAAKIVVASGQ